MSSQGLDKHFQQIDVVLYITLKARVRAENNLAEQFFGPETLNLFTIA